MVKELAPLLKRAHEDAHRGYDLNPDWNRYFEYERAGILRIWTARSSEGVLVGFAVCLVVHGLHDADTPHCFCDPFWLAPEWRDGLLGLRFIRSAIAAVKGLGVRALRWEVNDKFMPDEHGRSRVAGLLERVGFEQIGTVMEMRV